MWSWKVLVLTLSLAVLVSISDCSRSYNPESRARRLQDFYGEIRDLQLQEEILQLLSRNTEFEDSIRDWLNTYNEELDKWNRQQALCDYNYLTNLTKENAKKTTELDVQINSFSERAAEEAKTFLQRKSDISDETLKRALRKIAYDFILPPTKDEDLARETSDLQSELEGIYGNAQIEKDGVVYGIEPKFTELMTTSRDWDERLWAWVAWRNITGPKMRPLYTQLVRDMTKDCTDYGWRDCSEAWVGDYDVDNFEAMVDKLYEEIRPLYEQLHAYVRRGIMKQYPGHGISETEPIPAHVVDNMWSQQWTTMMDFLTPYPEFASYDVTPALRKQHYTPLRMFKLAEDFFLSIGLEPMTDKFWKYSMIEKPDDRPVQCHGSAFDMSTGDDFRIKMCTEITMGDLQTIHHEMGHIEYYTLYKAQPAMYREGANHAFHEAVGDTIALSVMTPEHLNAVGLLEDSDSDELDNPERDINEKDINFLMKTALEKIAFLPFGFLIDKYRWEIFRGNIDESNYESKWWQFRTKYQGLKAPVPRTEEDFDPGAKYHVPANVPYIRYFLSFLGQFQFNEALCKAKGHKGPLHRCDIFQSKEAGDLLRSGLSLGSSKPWPDVMEILTGQREFSSQALRNYFEPLIDWLKEQNQGRNVGWTG